MCEFFFLHCCIACYFPQYRNCVITYNVIRYCIYYEILYLHKEAWKLDESYGPGKKTKQAKQELKIFWFRKYVHILSKFSFLYNI